ncbi:hypothetical protein CUMW_226680 [Citrus unshiu]|uniref:Serine-threonine/tyrosine-protein kinase catalytic domain-containing protein n=1 Tax=Citrus unshiu TaxID=55188 RepID=A0A2H5QG61_CITUN|nr:hypothetical protein CUMW_226680 [Citrus unshiu]
MSAEKGTHVTEFARTRQGVIHANVQLACRAMVKSAVEDFVSPLLLEAIFGEVQVVVVCLECCFYYSLEKSRRKTMPKKKSFISNGGLLLQQDLTSNEGNIEKAKLFILKDIEKATDNYNDSRMLGQGGQGTKCDVYIFGVVLVKLLNEQKPVPLVDAEENRSLAAYFLQVMNENRLFEVFDAQVLREAEKEEVITVAMVKKRFLNLDGKKRPTMKEVALELQNSEEIGFVGYDNTRHIETGSSSTLSFLNCVTFSFTQTPLISNKW